MVFDIISDSFVMLVGIAFMLIFIFKEIMMKLKSIEEKLNAHDILTLKWMNEVDGIVEDSEP